MYAIYAVYDILPKKWILLFLQKTDTAAVVAAAASAEINANSITSLHTQQIRQWHQKQAQAKVY